MRRFGYFARDCGASLATSHQRLALVLWLQALGVFASDMIPGMVGLVLGSLLVGGGFLCVVQLSLQYGRELAPNHTRYMAGLLTTGYAMGQLVGPILSALSTSLTGQLEPALYVAGFALLLQGFGLAKVLTISMIILRNYRSHYWIMRPRSRTMSAHFAPCGPRSVTPAGEKNMSSLSTEATLVHEALVARGLETPLRPQLRELDNETRKREIQGI